MEKGKKKENKLKGNKIVFKLNTRQIFLTMSAFNRDISLSNGLMSYH